MKGKVVVLAFCLVSVVSACTSLNSKRLADDKLQHSLSGLTYRLPAKQFLINATYEITGCKVKDDKVDLDALVNVSFTESLIGAEAYTIDYQKLSKWTKVTDTEFQLSEAGLLTHVNASIYDRSGAVIKDSVTAAASIARAVAFPSAIPLQLSRVESRSMLEESTIPKKLQTVTPKIEDQRHCKSVNDTLKAKKDAEDKLKAEKRNDKERVKQESIINEATLQIKVLQSLVETYEKLGNEVDKTKLLDRIKLHMKTKEEAEVYLNLLGESETEEILKNLAEAKNKLIVTGSKEFVPTASTTSADVIVKSDDLRKLFDEPINIESVELSKVTLFVTKSSIDIGNENKTPLEKEIGIAYRIPVAAVARIYHQEARNSLSDLLLEKTTQVPQLGPIGSINLDNEIFEDNLIDLVFNDATGAPSRLKFQAKSKAEGASATLRDAAGAYLQSQKDKRDDQIATNKALLDQATTQVALRKAQSDLTLSEIQAGAMAAKTEAELQQSLISARLKLLQDQQRIEEIRAGTASPMEVEVNGLRVQKDLLEKRLEILKLEQQITEQKAKSSLISVP